MQALVELLKHHSRIKRWHGRTYRAVTLGEWSYWDIWPVINRKPTRYAGWNGEPTPPRDWLPEHLKRNLLGSELMPWQPGYEIGPNEAIRLFDPEGDR